MLVENYRKWLFLCLALKRKSRLWIVSVLLMFGGCEAQTVQRTSSAMNRECQPRKAYVPIKGADPLRDQMQRRKLYRLVIGAGEFQYDPVLNRQFVEPTAQMIDKRLNDLGYLPLPSLEKSAKPYLSGAGAKKQAIKDALKEIVQITEPEDLVVIYYLGHGSVTPSNKDLSLSVYDRPVAEDEGIRVSDLLATLELGRFRRDISEMPGLIVVLETCYSGNVTRGSRVGIITDSKGVQRLEAIGGELVPPQVVLLSATVDGDTSRAYGLHGSRYSAFGYFFARALKEEWACVDRNVDGILTVEEMKEHLQTRLHDAFQYAEIDGQMEPASLGRDRFSFIAYDPSRYGDEGDRMRIIRLLLTPAPGQTAQITLPSGYQRTCSSSCAVGISPTALGKIAFSSFEVPKGVPNANGAPADIFVKETKGSIELKTLLQRKKTTVGGASLQVQ